MSLWSAPIRRVASASVWSFFFSTDPVFGAALRPVGLSMYVLLSSDKATPVRIIRRFGMGIRQLSVRAGWDREEIRLGEQNRPATAALGQRDAKVFAFGAVAGSSCGWSK
ncbi:hypothetical protein BGZ63DRAFT_403856 [Mariannaea sp. PMI_226]|nr:hypothetical protein BGZ63DRAFT_403856 [Mariannaea sp. PMI_226]